MYSVALTGGIGAGKSIISHLFETHGVTVFDADIMAKALVKPGTACLEQITAHFGRPILNKDGQLNRAKLRQIISTDHTQRHWLNALMHPMIRQQLHDALLNATGPYALLVIPLLKTTADYPYINRVLVIDCPAPLQLSRLMARDNINNDQAQQIIDTQPSRDARLKLADDVIMNDGNLHALPQHVSRFHKKYLIEAKRSSQ